MLLEVDLLPNRKPRVRALSFDECTWICDLLKEGVPLSQCLLLLKSKKNEYVISSIISALEQGENSSQFFFKSKVDLMMFEFFQSLYSLAEALDHSLLIIQTKRRLIKGLFSKLLYPFVILVISCFCLLFVCFWVMPSVFSMIGGMGIESDSFLYFVCVFLSVVLFAFLVGSSVAGVVVFEMIRSGKIVLLFEKIGVNFIRSILKFIFTLLFCTYLNVLLAQEIPTRKALMLLEGIEDGCTNIIASKCRMDLENGISFQDSIKSCSLILDEYAMILGLGEVSNQVLKYSLNYEKLALLKVERIMKLLIQSILGVSYVCVGICAVVIMELLMSPLQLFELL